MKTHARKLSPEQWAKQRIETLEKALQFYAKHLGQSHSLDYRIIVQDGGKRAREALGASDNT